jgi:hypothetical protein
LTAWFKTIVRDQFVKDLWYRNQQEKIKGELDLEAARMQNIEKYLSLKERLSPSHDLVVIVSEGVEGLLELEHSGKLKSVGEHIESSQAFE